MGALSSVVRHREEQENGLTVSQTQVLMSNAGYYIGHTYHDTEFDAWLPYDRISGYFPTREHAQKVLDTYKEESR